MIDETKCTLLAYNIPPFMKTLLSYFSKFKSRRRHLAFYIYFCISLNYKWLNFFIFEVFISAKNVCRMCLV